MLHVYHFVKAAIVTLHVTHVAHIMRRGHSLQTLMKLPFYSYSFFSPSYFLHLSSKNYKFGQRQKLQDATALLDATVAHCNLTFVSIHRRIAKALFMPLNLTFASLVSRIAAVASHLRSTVAATYAMIRPCLDWASSRDVDGGGNPLPWTLPLPNKSGDSVLREMTSAVQKNEEDGAAEIGVGSLGDDEEGITAENGNQNAGSGTVLAAAAAACDGDSHDEMDVLFGGGASVVINRSEYRIARGSNTCNQNPKAEATLKSKQSMSSGNSSTASAKGGVRRVIARGIDDAGCAGAKRKSFGFMFAAAAVVATAISDNDNDDDIGADDDANHGASKNTELKVSKKLKRGTKTKAKAKAKAKANKDEDRSAPSISAHPKESNDEETLKKEKKKKKKKKKVKKLTKDTKNNSKAKGGASGPEGGVDEIDSIFG